jgi:hypothetical protein
VIWPPDGMTRPRDPEPLVLLKRGHWMRRTPEFDCCGSCGDWRRNHPYRWSGSNPSGCLQFRESGEDRVPWQSSFGLIYLPEES